MHNCLVKLGRRTQPAVTLVWLPHAGGSSAYFEELADRLPGNVESLGFDYPGRARRWREPLKSDLMEISAEVAAALATLSGPYVVFGHSMGALVGYEACRLIEAARDRRPKLLVISSCNPPHVPLNLPMLHRAKDETLIKRISVLGGIVDLGQSGEELLRLSLPVLRSDVTAVEVHRFVPWPKTRQDLAIYGGRNDVMVPVEHIMHWEEITAGTAKLREFDGGHFYMLQDPAALLEALARDVLEVVNAT